jgi:hypothetical protein
VLDGRWDLIGAVMLILGMIAIILTASPGNAMPLMRGILTAIVFVLPAGVIGKMNGVGARR